MSLNAEKSAAFEIRVLAPASRHNLYLYLPCLWYINIDIRQTILESLRALE